MATLPIFVREVLGQPNTLSMILVAFTLRCTSRMTFGASLTTGSTVAWSLPCREACHCNRACDPLHEITCGSRLDGTAVYPLNSNEVRVADFQSGILSRVLCEEIVILPEG